MLSVLDVDVGGKIEIVTQYTLFWNKTSVLEPDNWSNSISKKKKTINLFYDLKRRDCPAKLFHRKHLMRYNQWYI